MKTYLLTLLMVAVVFFTYPQEKGAGNTGAVQKSRADVPGDDLQKILKGVADYCRLMEGAAFHFICKEEVSEVIDLNPGHVVPRSWQRVNSSIMAPGKHFKRFLYHYRLVKKKADIKEDRDLLDYRVDETLENENQEQAITPANFFSQRAVLAANTLFAADIQDKYQYRLVGFDKVKGRRAAVIEVIPKDSAELNSIYGKAWVDANDFSLIKLEADPRSIIGYERYRQRAEEIKADLHLSLRAQFFQIHKGLRFPTQITIKESYKGTRFIPGKNTLWERTKTVISYRDYRFFYVNTEVIKEKME